METSIVGLKARLSAEYKYRTELHAHTFPVSGCSQVSPERMADIYAKRGYDGLALTNHFLWGKDKSVREYVDFFMNGYYETAAAAAELKLKVYLGAEIRFTENINDYLVYGADREALEEIYELLPFGIENFAKRRGESERLRRLVIVQAHPFRDGMTRIDAGLVDGVEGFNVPPPQNSRNALAMRFAHENEDRLRIITAGSDFHYPDRGFEGLAALRSKALPEDTFELAELLRSGDYLLEVGERAIILP